MWAVGGGEIYYRASGPVEQGSDRRVLTGSGEGDAEVRDRQQLRRVDAASSQQLHEIPGFCAAGRGPLCTSNVYGFMTGSVSRQVRK